MRAWMGLLVLSACGHAGAIERAQTDVLRNPSDVQGWIDLGDAYRKDGQGDAAAQAYGQALRLDPSNDSLRDRIGSRASSGEARALELQVLADPDNDELWGDLGDAYAEMGDRVTALRHYQYALSLDADDSEWQRKVIEFMPQGDVDAMQQALANSNDDEAIGDLADRMREQGREAEACELYLRALVIDPGDNEWVTAATSCGIEDIGDRIRQAAMTSGNDERIGDVGDYFAEQGDSDSACAMYTEAARIDPDDSEWQDNLRACSPEGMAELRREALASNDDERIGDAGDMLRNAGDHDGACELYSRALSLDPDDSEWIQNMQACGMGFQDYEGRPAPMPGIGAGTMVPAPGGEGLVALGRAALRDGNTREALQHFEAALLDNPGDRDARVGVMVVANKTLTTLLEELTAAHGEDDELWGDLGDAYLESGREADAQRAFERAAQIDPDDFEWSSKLDVLDPSRMGNR